MNGHTSEIFPWVRETLQAAALRRGDRALQVTIQEPFLLRGLVDACGPDGVIVAVEPNAERADVARAAHGTHVDVLTFEPNGTETLGRFDAVVASPTWNPGLDVAVWGEVLRSSLRLGGRFVLDLPADSCCELIEEAWDRAGGSATARAHWRGFATDLVERTLRECGLRDVSTATATHFARFESPLAVAECAVAGVQGEDLTESLRVALTERVQSVQEVEVVFRRVRVSGLR